MSKSKSYQIDVSKKDLIGGNISHYIDQASYIVGNLVLRDKDGDTDSLSWKDDSILTVAKMLQKEDHLVRTIESK